MFDFLSNAFCPKSSTLPRGTLWPSLIVPISKTNPDKTYGGSDHTKAEITPGDMCTIFNFVLPDTMNDKPIENQNCSLIFDFPNKVQNPWGYSSSGDGHFTFTGYTIGSGATNETTYNTQPPAGPSPSNPPDVMKSGNSYIINNAPCGIPPGTGNVTVSGALCSNDSSLSFHQTNRFCPMGMFVVVS